MYHSHFFYPSCKQVYDLGLYGGDYVWILPESLQTYWWNTDKYCSKQKLLETLNGIIFLGSKRQLNGDEVSVSFLASIEM